MPTASGHESVFEWSVDEMELEKLRDRLEKCIDEMDSLGLYYLVEPREKHMDSYG